MGIPFVFVAAARVSVSWCSRDWTPIGISFQIRCIVAGAGEGAFRFDFDALSLT
jgi:hypothetical protein